MNLIKEQEIFKRSFTSNGVVNMNLNLKCDVILFAFLLRIKGNINSCNR